MQTFLKPVALASALLFTAPVIADDDYGHFKGKPSETLEQAVANFSEYNTKLEKVLAGDLTPEAMNEIHELTYTIENALARINEEFDGLAVTLEEIHLSSERMETDQVQEYGEQYLDTSRKVIE